MSKSDLYSSSHSIMGGHKKSMRYDDLTDFLLRDLVFSNYIVYA